jgi:hypothetical protein
VAASDDVIAESILDKRAWVGSAEQALEVGFILCEQEVFRLIAV